MLKFLELKFLDKWQGESYALLRIVSGFMFSLHGLQKLFGVLDGTVAPVGTQMWFAGVIEAAGGIAIALGLRTRIAAFIASGEMAVAYFQVHWPLRMDRSFFPILNHGELAALYSFLFLFIAIRGAGKWGVERS